MLCEAASAYKIREHEGQRGGVRCPGGRARSRKLTLPEWVRAEVLEAHDGAADEVLLGEVLALRTILINLLFSLGSGKPVTPESMAELIARADGDKSKRAMERLTALRATVPEPEPEPEAAAKTNPEEG